MRSSGSTAMRCAPSLRKTSVLVPSFAPTSKDQVTLPKSLGQIMIEMNLSSSSVDYVLVDYAPVQIIDSGCFQPTVEAQSLQNRLKGLFKQPFTAVLH